MLQPQLVRSIVESMRAEVKIPISVKCRIGVDGFSTFVVTCRPRLVRGAGALHLGGEWRVFGLFCSRGGGSAGSRGRSLRDPCEEVLAERSLHSEEPSRPSAEVRLGIPAAGRLSHAGLHPQRRRADVQRHPGTAEPSVVAMIVLFNVAPSESADCAE